jgi:xylulokinase
MHSSVFLDRRGAVIRPALLWCDGRTTAECAEIVRRVGGEPRLRELTCNPPLEGFTLPKILWLRNHEPESFARLTTILLAKDYIRYRLTGVLACEPSDASGTLLFDTAHWRWSGEMLDAMELPDTLLPELGASAAMLGRVTSAAAAETGLPAATPVAGGGGDNACGALGVGVVAPGQGVASWGTSGTVLAPTNRPATDPASRLHTFCHVAPGTWYAIGVVLTAGAAFAWYRDRFAREYADANEAGKALRDEAAAIAPGADGVTFLPYLQGERTPHRDASLRGALLGLSLAHSRGHVTRAVLEGVCFALRDSLELLRDMRMAPDQLLLTGGGASHQLLRQLQADVLGVPVCLANREEGPAYGAALLAAVGAGAFPDVSAAVRRTLSSTVSETPGAEARAAYDALFARFRSALIAARPFPTSGQPRNAIELGEIGDPRSRD